MTMLRIAVNSVTPARASIVPYIFDIVDCLYVVSTKPLRDGYFPALFIVRTVVWVFRVELISRLRFLLHKRSQTSKHTSRRRLSPATPRTVEQRYILFKNRDQHSRACVPDSSKPNSDHHWRRFPIATEDLSSHLYWQPIFIFQAILSGRRDRTTR